MTITYIIITNIKYKPYCFNRKLAFFFFLDYSKALPILLTLNIKHQNCRGVKCAPAAPVLSTAIELIFYHRFHVHVGTNFFKYSPRAPPKKIEHTKYNNKINYNTHS